MWQVIARVGKLQVLNGSEVSTHERRESEIQFLREIAGLQTLLAYQTREMAGI